MLNSIKKKLKRSPTFGPAIERVENWQRARETAGLSTEEIFNDVLRRKVWGGESSDSGTGSDLAQTEQIVTALPGLFREHRVRSMLDIPCGDFHWMRMVDLGGVSYVGADIVSDLVEKNQPYATDQITFRHLDLLVDPLPKVDLILCRDCLVHLSFEDIFRALENMSASESTLLLTTTFPEHERNLPISTGGWRTLNLERSPFSFPPPSRLINEACTEENGQYADKSLGLWRISDLHSCRRE